MKTNFFKIFPILILSIAFISCTKNDPESEDLSKGLFLYDVSNDNHLKISDDFFSKSYAFSDDCKSLFYVSNEGTYAYDILSKETTKLMEKIENPSWSANTKKVAYINNGELYVVDWKGNNKQQFTNCDCYNIQWPMFSNDNLKVMCNSLNSLLLVSLDGEVKEISYVSCNDDNQLRYWCCDWSSDSDRVLLLKTESYIDNGLSIYELSSGKFTPLDISANVGHYAKWRPYYEQILVATYDNINNTFLSLVDIKGLKHKNIYQFDNLVDTEFDWSLDGTQIVFTSLTDLMIINVDGSGHKLITEDKAVYQFPLWSADSKYILYSKNERADL